MPISILVIFLASMLAAFFYKRHPHIIAAVLSAILLGNVVYFISLTGTIFQGDTLTTQVSWISSLDIHFTFYLDGLSLFFALLITVFGLLILIYSVKYMEHSSQVNRFICYLLLFMGSMLGLVLSANLISLFMFWELTSFTSFLLIGFKHQKDESRRAARQALLITAGGGLALMAGFILLENITGSGFNLGEILSQADKLESSGLQSVAILLIAVGAFTKSAQFPFHFWLPNAMAAPTPVSAYLHSATMVKAGVYLVFRLNPLFDEVIFWDYLLGITGALTMIWGALKAFGEDDLKRILAYTTISALGIFFMMIGVGGQEAIHAAMIYVMAHALYKGSLFLAAGSIEHETGTRHVSQLSDLVRKMPITAGAVIMATASMAGILPFLGFIGKESLYHALYHGENEYATVYLTLLFLAGAFFTGVTIKIVYHTMLKKGPLRHKPIHEPHGFMVFPPLLLALAGLITGLIPGIGVEPLLQWSAASIYEASPTMELKLWHGFNIVFLLSVMTILTGAGLYYVRHMLDRFRKPYWLEGDFLYTKTVAALESLATLSTQILQNGLLRNYIAIVLLAFSGILLFALVDAQYIYPASSEELLRDMQIYEGVIFAFVIVATIFLFKTRSRLIVTATFGIVGYSIALAYTLFSAPDVAITQFLAETLTLILLILILHRLPSYTVKKPFIRIKYLPVALFFGIMMTITAFIMLNQNNRETSKTYFLENSLSEGKGQNAVNVILVDFRALDTLGEITVLTITMIGIIALIQIKPTKYKL